ncbi:Sorting nexin-14 [Amphibalanus amphitrite]|uniref:Sorting nexin-14 n=1 Tax=Amphibalanus amphitrite TaxID=1232801 RepID=A0A6A4X9G6_AMPAM|nr:Sorting nexin-14 [Amphibalanus amphitrite]
MLLALLVLLLLAALAGVLLADALGRRGRPFSSLWSPAVAAVGAARPAGCLLVPQTVDAALERLLESLLAEHLAPWSQLVSADPAFLHEVRLVLRCACTELARRALRVELSVLVLRRLIPAGVCHLDCCLLARRLHRSGLLSDQAAWDYYGRDAHAAVSAGGEGRYLRTLASRVTPLLLAGRPCRAGAGGLLLRELLAGAVLRPLLDLLADPDTVNQLLLLLLSPEKLDPCPVDNSPSVELLLHWTQTSRPPPGSALAVDLSGVLKSADLLYALMQCLKERGALNLVQFCLAVEEFNQRMLNPELNDEQLRNLYTEASHIYNSFLRPESADFVGADRSACEQVHEVLCGRVEEITRLRRMKALFEAYEQAYNRLEQEHMPDFLSSGHYLSQLCRRQAAAGRAGRGRVLRSVTAVARWGRRLREALRPATVDGQVDEQFELGEEYVPEEEEEDEVDALTGDLTCDLSAWTVAVPTVCMATDAAGKPMIQFVLEVTRPTADGQNGAPCRVKRRLNEFYVLEKKLMEFHGELGDVRLPPKQSLLASSFYTQDFLDCRKELFASFLRRLLVLPGLGGSQLVRAFISSEQPFVDDLQQEINIGRIIRTVPRKFRKERGQNLEHFLSGLLSSTEPAAPGRPRARADCSDMEPVLWARRGPREEPAASRRAHTVARPSHECPLSGLYDTLCFLACRLFEAPRWLLALLRGARPLLRHSTDALADRLLAAALAEALAPPARLARLAELARAGAADAQLAAHRRREGGARAAHPGGGTRRRAAAAGLHSRRAL